MKITAAILIASVLALTLANNSPQEDDNSKLVEEFFECLVKALDGGLPSADIPNHNPLAPPRVINETFEFLGTTVSIMVHDIVLWNITQIREPANLTTVTTETGVNVTYEVWWDELFSEAHWEVEIGDQKLNGTFTSTLTDVVFSGNFDMTLKPDGEILGNLDWFSVIPTCVDAKVVIDGLGVIIDPVINLVASVALKLFVNTPNFFEETVSPALQERLNNLWVKNATRVSAIIDNCST